MDPASYCVYNVTRNALLSERVVSVSEPQTPPQLLALVMNGPGRDPHFCIRLTNVSLVPDIPRLFAFDVAYLDIEQRILEVAEVGPSTPFPALTDSVATILFLSDQLLAKSGTEAGDFIRICTEAELAALLRAAAQFQAVESPGWPIESPGPSSTIAPDPFAGSLIYLPSSGTPQNSEIFLASYAPPLEEADSTTEEAFVEPIADLITSDAPTPYEITELVNDELPPPQQSDSKEFEPELDLDKSPLTTTPPLARFFETASQTQLPDESPSQTQKPVAPEPSQLPFNLQAIIQFVDDQLRREKEQQDQPPRQRPPENISKSADAALAESFDARELRERNSAPDQLISSFAEEESTEILPGLSTAYVPELPDSNAAAGGEPEAESTREPSVNEIGSKDITLPLVPPAASTSAPNHARTRTWEPVPDDSGAVESRRAAPSQPGTNILEPPAAHAEIGPPSTPTPSAEPKRPIHTFPKEKLPFAARVQRWLAGESISLSGNRRRGERIALPGLVAFYFTGGAPKPHEIVNISSSGLYLRSKELWSPNTLVRMTLERQDAELGEKKSISVLARVVRIDDGGIGHEFVTTEVLANLRARDFLPQQGTNRKALEKFLSGPK